MTTICKHNATKLATAILTAALLAGCSNSSPDTSAETNKPQTTQNDGNMQGGEMSGNDGNMQGGEMSGNDGNMQGGEMSGNTQAGSEVSAEGLRYEENIGKDLRNASCYLMDNVRTWVETDLELAMKEVNKILDKVKAYRESSGNYITDPDALKKFQESLDSSLAAGSQLEVSLVSRDLSGLANVALLIEGMQNADRSATTSLGIRAEIACD